jgi:hypothetical protein
MHRGCVSIHIDGESRIAYRILMEKLLGKKNIQDFPEKTSWKSMESQVE